MKLKIISKQEYEKLENSGTVYKHIWLENDGVTVIISGDCANISLQSAEWLLSKIVSDAIV